MAQLMPLPLTVSCFSKIEIGFTFLVPAHPDSPGQWAVKRVCVCGKLLSLCGGLALNFRRQRVLSVLLRVLSVKFSVRVCVVE